MMGFLLKLKEIGTMPVSYTHLDVYKRQPYIIQGIGHGDLIRDTNGDWHILCLGFRQIHIWHTFHHLGREVFLIPVSFDQDGWFTAGNDGTAEETYELKGDFEQITKDTYTFENTNWNLDWCFLRHPHLENYTLEDNKAILRGTSVTIDEADSPTFLAIRQRDFKGNLRCHLSIDNGEAGITIYMSELEHYDIAIRKNKEQYECVLKLNVGTIKHEEKAVPLANPEADLCIRLDNEEYTFSVKEQEMCIRDRSSAEIMITGISAYCLILFLHRKNSAPSMTGIYISNNMIEIFVPFSSSTSNASNPFDASTTSNSSLKSSATTARLISKSSTTSILESAVPAVAEIALKRCTCLLYTSRCV